MRKTLAVASGYALFGLLISVSVESQDRQVRTDAEKSQEAAAYRKKESRAVARLEKEPGKAIEMGVTSRRMKLEESEITSLFKRSPQMENMADRQKESTEEHDLRLRSVSPAKLEKRPQ